MLKYKINISDYDIELWNAMEKEKQRQEEHIELIASENYTSQLVMQAQGSQLTNKYAEGYPGKRYYGGCKYIDIIEQLAIDRAKKIFNANYANVQPHSGSQANAAVYMAFLQPGDTLLGMSLDCGGHLTHGAAINFSGKLYNSISYGVNEDGEINYDEIKSKAKKHKPKMIVAGFSAYSGIINWDKIREIADSVNSYLLVDMSHVAGLIAAGIYPNPVPYAHVVTSTTHKTLAGPRGGLILSKEKDIKIHKKINSAVFPGLQGGPLLHVIAGKAIALKEAMEPKFKIYQQQTVINAKTMVKIFQKNNYKIISNKTENHLFLIDLINKNITGNIAEIALSDAKIIVNKNNIPHDSKSPIITSGIRIGSPAITRRGFKEKETSELTKWICNILNDISNKKTIENIKEKVINICKKFPVYNL
ncbi:Serine hydroxymethyltransferase [Candidatus Providencia siddallii]|uniref:Serine hydroxymethyltransferase n=1 Tax=Candidatus Providencia siddallii TaxID=1715285 RepID=A0A0M6W9F8_9GAMM|nr:Serine hydroxymethyltransferase [Candidatus Providencia siddallii]